MKQTGLTPAENLRLQARYMPELVEGFISAQEKKPVREAEEVTLPRKRVVLCEEPVALLRREARRPLFQLPSDSPLWEELEELGVEPLQISFRPDSPRLEHTDEGVILSGNGCWLKSQFPVVLLPGPVPLNSPLLEDAAAIYVLRPLTKLECSRLEKLRGRIVEVDAGDLPELLENRRCCYPPKVLTRPEHWSWSGGGIGTWNDVAVTKDSARAFSRFSQPRSAKLWVSDLVYWAQERLADLFFENLNNEFSAANEPLELRFTRSYLAVALYGKAERQFTQAMTGKARGCVKRMAASKTQVEKQTAFTEFDEQVIREIRERIPPLQEAVWEEWRKLEWWE